MKKTLTLLFTLLTAGFMFAQTVSVEFRVNMNVQKGENTFTPATDSVHISGTFNNWNTSANPMTDSNNDLIYTTTVGNFTAGDTIEFKFVKGDKVYEDGNNRKLVIPSTNSIYTAYYSNDSIVNASIAITFAANMEYEIVSGRFNPLTDTLTVRGPFNGWSAKNPMSPSVGDPNMYEVTVNVPTALNDSVNYKFNIVPNGWEGGDNRIYVVTQNDINNGSAYVERVFNDLTPDVITLNNVVIKFTVDVTDAVNSLTGAPFSAPITSVAIAGANPPLAWPGTGWPNADSTLVHFMYDDGTHGDAAAGDKIWTVELTFPKYSPLRVEYKYGANWGLEGNSNDNESSIGTNHILHFTPDLMSGTVVNKWSQMGDHPLIDVVSDVKELPGVVTKYDLGQNYPNPFNPSTSIHFSIPQAGQVTLKVFNLLGQEVTTLVNEFKNAGNYSVNFNAANMTSGLYFYQINVNNFTSIKKMMLIK